MAETCSEVVRFYLQFVLTLICDLVILLCGVPEVSSGASSGRPLNRAQTTSTNTTTTTTSTARTLTFHILMLQRTSFLIRLSCRLQTENVVN